MGSFKPISKERATEIRAAIKRAGSRNEGLAFDKQSGNLMGTMSVKSAPADQVNVISNFDTHYSG